MSKNMTVAKCKSELEDMLKFPATRQIRKVYNKLSIFDWWKDGLTVTDQKSMLAFLKTAERMGFNGYCCFKVGITGCANGMWAYRNRSTDGYSPDGDFLYRSFTPEYKEWYMTSNGSEVRTSSLRELKLVVRESDFRKEA